MKAIFLSLFGVNYCKQHFPTTNEKENFALDKILRTCNLVSFRWDLLLRKKAKKRENAKLFFLNIWQQQNYLIILYRLISICVEKAKYFHQNGSPVNISDFVSFNHNGNFDKQNFRILLTIFRLIKMKTFVIYSN